MVVTGAVLVVTGFIVTQKTMIFYEILLQMGQRYTPNSLISVYVSLDHQALFLAFTIHYHVRPVLDHVWRLIIASKSPSTATSKAL